MRYAFITDIHGKRNNLEKVLEHIQTFSSIHEIICLGDVFEVKVPKKDLKDFQFQSIEQVLDLDWELIDLLKGIRVIKGNQEERILSLIPEKEIPIDFYNFLTHMPLDIYLTPMVRLTHGHTFDWMEEEDYWRPSHIHYWSRPWIFYGHNHQNVLFEVQEKKNHPYYERKRIINGKPITLDAASRYLINIGDMKYDHPSWMLLDTLENQITYNILY
ncbi:metallophosphoesterase [Bacillus halotolerans]|uniref:metallophosphoesterase n=1 Tax=Bacillus halotolerans TaxID=260554 RepID=UPI00292F36E4|nr:metallophosphoesterase [Bacillus halotolerans]